MYLTAQHVRRSDGVEEIHTFLHAHDTVENAFPEEAAQVALHAPGRLVAKAPAPEVRKVTPGGNAIVAYIDIVAKDALWSPRWLDCFPSLREQISRGSIRSGAWTLGPCYVEFSARNEAQPTAEFDALLVEVTKLAPADQVKLLFFR